MIPEIVIFCIVILVAYYYHIPYIEGEIIVNYTKFRIPLIALGLPSQVIEVGGYTKMFASGRAFGPKYEKDQQHYLDGNYIVFHWIPNFVTIKCENGDNYVMVAVRDKFEREHDSSGSGSGAFTEYYVHSQTNERLHYKDYVPRYNKIKID